MENRKSVPVYASLWLAVTLVVTGFPSSASAEFAPSGLLEIHYINVQKGGCTLVIGPNGTTILMDAGDHTKGTREIVPYLESIGLRAEDGIDYTLAGHLDSDHVGGFDEVIEAGYDVRTKNYFNGSSKSGGSITEYKTTTGQTSAGTPEKIPLGQEIDLGDDAKLTVMAVAGDVIGFGMVEGSEKRGNDLSIAVLVEYGNFDFIWASDLGGGDDDQGCTGRVTRQANVETPLAQSITPGGAVPLLSDEGVDVLHVNHHGSESSTNSDWVNLLKPEVPSYPWEPGRDRGLNIHVGPWWKMS